STNLSSAALSNNINFCLTELSSSLAALNTWSVFHQIHGIINSKANIGGKKDEEAKVVENAQVQGRQAESQAEIYKINMDHALKVLSMQEDEPAKVQEVVDVVTTAKLVTEIVVEYVVLGMLMGDLKELPLAREEGFIKFARSPQQNGFVERRNRTLIEAARTMLIYAQAPLFLRAEAMVTACFTQNRSIIRLRHGKTLENVGKLQPKADIGIFIGYALTKKAFRIYNRRTRRIVETIHVDFDELTAMAFEQSTSYVPPSRNDWDLLFQPLFDELLNPPLSVDNQAAEVIAPIAEVIPQVDDDSTGSPSLTTVDQDGPSPSNTPPKTSKSGKSITAEDPLIFDELISTTIDFSKFAKNRLKLDKITKEDLVGPIYNLLKGTYQRNIELEYNMEECYKALTDRPDMENHEGDRYPFDLSKPLPLKGRPVVLRMFTRSLIIKKRVEDVQLGVESYQKKLNITKPQKEFPGISAKEL
nr:hypothetical protein [Tanacetum cinerariifolium]